MEKILIGIAAIIGAITAIVTALTLLLKGINYLIRESSLVATNVRELRKYGFKRRKKNGDVPLDI